MRSFMSIVDKLDIRRLQVQVEAILVELSAIPAGALNWPPPLPLAPHVAEELWERLGHEATLAYEDFPTADPAWLSVDTVEIAVQLDGTVMWARIGSASDRS